jgi:hypothetical protein
MLRGMQGCRWLGAVAAALQALAFLASSASAQMPACGPNSPPGGGPQGCTFSGTPPGGGPQGCAVSGAPLGGSAQNCSFGMQQGGPPPNASVLGSASTGTAAPTQTGCVVWGFTAGNVPQGCTEASSPPPGLPQTCFSVTFSGSAPSASDIASLSSSVSGSAIHPAGSPRSCPAAASPSCGVSTSASGGSNDGSSGPSSPPGSPQGCDAASDSTGSGLYCTLPAGGQVWVSAGASSTGYGC